MRKLGGEMSENSFEYKSSAGSFSSKPKPTYLISLTKDELLFKCCTSFNTFTSGKRVISLPNISCSEVASHASHIKQHSAKS